MSTFSTCENSSHMGEDARVLLQAVHAIGKGWSQEFRSFRYEPARYVGKGIPPAQPSEVMQAAFQNELAARLPPEWSVLRETFLLSRRRPYSQFGPYDIEVRHCGRQVALLELSCRDTDVCHALHNGELKLLGNCHGIGKWSKKPFSEQPGFTPEGLAGVCSQLQAIPVRGLFFVSQKPYRALQWEEDALWHPTPIVDHFQSALLPHKPRTTLAEVFPELAKAGLHCWFYSAGTEETREPPEYFPAQA